MARKRPALLLLLVSGSESAQEAPFVTPLTAPASHLATVNLIEYKINRSEQGAGNKTTGSAIMQGIFYELYTPVYIRSNETVIKVRVDDRKEWRKAFKQKQFANKGVGSSQIVDGSRRLTRNCPV